MLGVIFHWDNKVGIARDGQRALFQTIDYTYRAFAADLVVMVDAESSCTLNPGGVTIVDSLDAALALFDGCVPVYLDSEAKEGLVDFVHPASPVYVIGPDFAGIKIPEEAVTVRIDYPGKIVLWSSVALGIVLYDRSAKQ